MQPLIVRAAIAFTFFITAVIVLSLVIAMSYGLDDYGMVKAFSSDEAHFVYQQQVYHGNGSLNPGDFFYYGQFFDLIGYASRRLG